MKLQKKSACHYVRITKRWGVTPMGKVFQVTCAVRAVKEDEGWRIDFCDNVVGAWLPWEPIDTVVRDSIAACERAIAEWLITVPEGV